MLKFGEKSIKSLYYGAKAISKAYLGSKLVFNKITKPYYCEVEYIESTGTQYIVSDVQFLGDNYTIKCKYDNSNTGSDTTPFGYQNTDSGIQIMVIGFNNVNSTGTIFWNGSTTAHTNRAKLNAFTKGLNDIVISANNGILTYQVNGGQKISYETYTAFEPQTDKMWIFGNNRKSASGSHQEVKMKFYHLAVEQNGIVLYDYIPVLDNNLKPCLYDKVSGKLFYNQGTGEFLYGRQIHKVEYLETTAQQTNSANTNDAAWIDTGIIPNNNTSMECRMQFTTLISSSQGTEALNGATSGGRFAWGFANVSPRTNFYMGLGAQNLNTTVARDTNVHIFKLDAVNETWAIDETTGTFSSVGSFTGTNSIYLFARHSGSNTYANKPVNAKIWYCKIWDSDILVRDFIPVLDENNVACMYDKITDEFFYSQGRRDLNYG